MSRLRDMIHRMRRARGHSAFLSGRASSLRPLSRHFGADRGTPIDRYYIDNFIAANSQDICGTVLEVVEPTYSHRFGGNRISTQHVVDLDRNNPRATIVGDLCKPGVLPTNAFDCIVLTQTLQHNFDVRSAIEQVARSLKPGGVALVTVPGISPLHPSESYDWYWAFTVSSVRRLVEPYFDADQLTVSAYGNLLAATAFLHGAAVEEVPTKRLDTFDQAYPVVITARAVARR